jgi:hypothetical protein
MDPQHCPKGNTIFMKHIPGDINLGAGQVLVVLESGELLRVPEGDGSHHVPAMQKSVSVFRKLW